MNTNHLHHPSRRRSTWAGYAAVAAAATLWGLSGALARYLFRQQVDALLLVHVRMTGSFLLLVMALALCRPALLRVPRPLWPRVATWGVLGMAAVQFLYLYAIQATSVATAIFLQYLSAVITALWVALVQRRWPGGAVLAALGLAVGGSALLVFGGSSGPAAAALPARGILAGLGSAVAFTFYALYGQRLMAALNPWTLLTWGLGAGALVWNLWLPPWQVVARVQTPALWVYFLYVCTLATVVPFGLFLWGLRRVPAAPAQITAMLEPLVAAAAAWAALGEALAPRQVLGGALILAAVAVVQGSSPPPAEQEPVPRPQAHAGRGAG